MKRQAITIDLLDDCVFSARAATVGGHESLDRVSGAALLGAAAGRLYASLPRQAAYAAFHSGRLRFGDGLPVHGNTVGWPVPHAWHYAKTAKPETDQRLQGARLYNFLHETRIEGDGENDAQPKQMRAGYVHADGYWSKPAHALRMKTAISAATGRAAEGQLFGYDALARGQRFVSCIEADADFDTELFERVLGALSGEVLLGRSRSAEYGRARVTRACGMPAPVHGAITGENLTLWLLSDLALCDEHGQPTLEPRPEYFGLGGGKIIWDKTFLRHRRYSPWNAARHGFDRERWALSAGGVISLQLNEAPTGEQLCQLAAGVGLYREAGLGRLWANPLLLATPHPAFDAAVPVSDSSEPSRPEDPLISWLEAEAQCVDGKAETEKKARLLASDYLAQVESACRAAGVRSGTDFGPSKAQWGRVLEAARSRSGRDLFNSLFVGESAIVKPGGEGWREEARAENGEWKSLAAWLEGKLEPDGDVRVYSHLVRQLAHRVRDGIDRRRK